MKNRILVVITIVLSIILSSISNKTNTTFFKTIKEKETINVLDSITNKISNLDLEEYIIGVVAAEMPASFQMEALKAQAVASRTYAIYKISTSNGSYDVVTDISNQSYIDLDKMHEKWQDDFDIYYNKIKEAVNSTKNQIMTYNDQVIEAYYFAMSNGYTEDSSLVFSESRDYLQSVASLNELNLKNFEVIKELDTSYVCNKLNINCPIEIQNIERSATHRVNTITINNKKFKGTEVRKLLELRSTDFDINISNDQVIFTTRGYGHGVGMSQYGANELAKDGKSYLDILNYYYKNIQINSI